MGSANSEGPSSAGSHESRTSSNTQKKAENLTQNQFAVENTGVATVDNAALPTPTTLPSRDATLPDASAAAPLTCPKELVRLRRLRLKREECCMTHKS